MCVLNVNYQNFVWGIVLISPMEYQGTRKWGPVVARKKYIRYISIICFSNKYSVPVTQSELCSIPGVAYTNEIVKRVLSYDQSIQGNLPVMFGPDIYFNHIFDLKSEVIAAFRVYT